MSGSALSAAAATGEENVFLVRGQGPREAVDGARRLGVFAGFERRELVGLEARGVVVWAGVEVEVEGLVLVVS